MEEMVDTLEMPTSPHDSGSNANASTSFDLNAPAFSSDDFRVWDMKVKRCPRARPHDWTICPFAHPGEKATRRDPRKYTYSATACADWKKTGQCSNGDACTFSHGVFECWLHPTRYRTQMCADGMDCKRRVCFFAHQESELRHPENCFVPPTKTAAPPPASHSDIQKQLIKALAGLLGNGPNGGAAGGAPSMAGRMSLDGYVASPPPSQMSVAMNGAGMQQPDVNVALAQALQELALGRSGYNPGRGGSAAQQSYEALLAAAAAAAGAQGYAPPPSLGRHSIDIGSLARTNPFGAPAMPPPPVHNGGSLTPTAAEAYHQEFLNQAALAAAANGAATYGSYGGHPTQSHHPHQQQQQQHQQMSSSWAMGEGYAAMHQWYETNGRGANTVASSFAGGPLSHAMLSNTTSGVSIPSRTVSGAGSDSNTRNSIDGGVTNVGLHKSAQSDRRSSSQSLSSSDGSEGGTNSTTNTVSQKKSTSGSARDSLSSGEESIHTLADLSAGESSDSTGRRSTDVPSSNTSTAGGNSGSGLPPRADGGVSATRLLSGAARAFSFDNLLAELPRSASQVKLTIS